MIDEAQRTELRRSIKDAAAAGDLSTALNAARQLVRSSSKPSDTTFAASALLSSKTDLAARLGAKSLKTFVVRSVTLEPILPVIKLEALFACYSLGVQLGSYGSFADELLNPDGALAAAKPDLVLITLDTEEIAGQLPDLCATGIDAQVDRAIERSVAGFQALLSGCRSNTSARIVLQGLVVPDSDPLGDVGDANLPWTLPRAVHELNRRLAVACNAVPDCIFFDIDRVAARHGRARWRDERMYLASRLPVSAEFFSEYARALVRSFSPLFRPPRKVLVTDLDNTLWGGILGEDGADGIATGTAFPGICYLEYQKYLKRLSARGILLAIASKNNESDVLEAFQLRKADLALTLDDFVARKISWTDKTESIREIAVELSLGLNSFVFVDDNPMECEAIRQALPEVTVIGAPIDEPWRLCQLISEQGLFDTVAITDDDLGRVEDYKSQSQRAELERSFGSRDEFLASMEIVCTFQSALAAPLSRSVQLLAKTNQFNLTTRRHSAAEVEQFASSPASQAIAVRVRDRFGDSGVVGLALARTEGDACVIDSILLSCRVIGRGVETALLAHIAENAVRAGASRLIGEFIPTRKNQLCASFYLDHGFTPLPQTEASGAVFYELDLTTTAPTTPKWITVEGDQVHEHATGAVVSS